MFRSEALIPVYKNLLGWRQHFDSSIVLPSELTTTETGEYYQDKSPALRLDYIKATLFATQSLDVYLTQNVEAGINGIFNDILQYRQVRDYGKTLLEQAQLLNRLSWAGEGIINRSRFVGMQIKVRDQTALQLVINEVGIQLTGPQTIKLYLFHSQLEEPIQEFEITTVNTSVQWDIKNFDLNTISPAKFHGGVFILGYYQDDLVTQAVNYSNFDWNIGECQSCDGGSYYRAWTSVRKHFFVYPIYFPEGNFIKGKLPDMNLAQFSNSESFGLNMKFTVRCDLTEFFIQNKFAFKNLLALKVSHLILNDMKFCQETSYIEENLKHMIIRDLEGDKETNYLNISQQYRNEIKAVTFNISSINNRCLDCEADAFQPVISVV